MPLPRRVQLGQDDLSHISLHLLAHMLQLQLLRILFDFCLVYVHFAGIEYQRADLQSIGG